MDHIDNKELGALCATIGICCLIDMQRVMPEHSKMAREIANVYEALRRLAQCNPVEIPDGMVLIATDAWMAGLHKLQSGLMERGKKVDGAFLSEILSETSDEDNKDI